MTCVLKPVGSKVPGQPARRGKGGFFTNGGRAAHNRLEAGHVSNAFFTLQADDIVLVLIHHLAFTTGVDRHGFHPLQQWLKTAGFMHGTSWQRRLNGDVLLGTGFEPRPGNQNVSAVSDDNPYPPAVNAELDAH
jgi:hypothetical protein